MAIYHHYFKKDLLQDWAFLHDIHSVCHTFDWQDNIKLKSLGMAYFNLPVLFFFFLCPFAVPSSVSHFSCCALQSLQTMFDALLLHRHRNHTESGCVRALTLSLYPPHPSSSHFFLSPSRLPVLIRSPSSL